MNFNKLKLGFLRGPESGESSGGSGGTTTTPSKGISAFASQILNHANNTTHNPDTGPDNGGDTGGESSDHSDSSATGDSGNRKTKKTSTTSAILQQLRKQQGSGSTESGAAGEGAGEFGDGDSREEAETQESGNADSQAGDHKESEQKGKEREREREPLTEEELLNSGEITTKDGKPVSAQVTVLVSSLKKHLRARSEEVARLKAEVAKGNNEALGNRIKELEVQLTEREKTVSTLQEQIDSEFFEKSAGFLETFKAPVDKSLEQIVEYFEKYNSPEYGKEQKALGDLMAKATKCANEGKRAAFLQVIDEIAEDYIEGGPSIKAAFVGDSKDFFNAQREYNKALTEKGENRKKLVQSKLEENRSKNRVGIERDIDSHLNKYEATNTRFLESLDETDRGKFKSLYVETAKNTKAMIAEYAATGVMPEALNSIIAKGITHDATAANAAIAWSAFRDGVNKVQILEKENKELKSKLARYTKDPDSSQSRSSGYREDSVNGNNGKPRSAIMEQLRSRPEFASQS